MARMAQMARNGVRCPTFSGTPLRPSKIGGWEAAVRDYFHRHCCARPDFEGSRQARPTTWRYVFSILNKIVPPVQEFAIQQIRSATSTGRRAWILNKDQGGLFIDQEDLFDLIGSERH
jgi:hypothetical protein